jgi:hypothetical protein
MRVRDLYGNVDVNMWPMKQSSWLVAVAVKA